MNDEPELNMGILVGQRDILQSIIEFASQKEKAAMELAQEQGLDIVEEGDEEALDNEDESLKLASTIRDTLVGQRIKGGYEKSISVRISKMSRISGAIHIQVFIYIVVGPKLRLRDRSFTLMSANTGPVQGCRSCSRCRTAHV